jgi:flagellar biosynthesis protein FlhA
MGLVPVMPHFTVLLLAGGLAAIAHYMKKKAKAEAEAPAVAMPEVTPKENPDVSWEDVQPVDILGLEVGYRLVPLVDRGQDGELLKRIKAIRKKFAQDIGFLPPAIHIRDNLELRPAAYRILLKGVEIAQHEAHAGMFLAINPGRVVSEVPGIATTDPAFGLPAVWVEADARSAAQAAGYTVVDASTVIATHLSQILNTHASELLGRQELQQLLDHLAKEMPKLTEDLVPKLLPLATLQKTLQNLLEEGVHIRDMRSIVESLAEHAATVTDPQELARRIRIHLAPSSVQQIYGGTRELDVIALEPELERLVSQALNSPHGAALDPGVADTIARSAAESAQRQEDLGQPACLLVPDMIRAPMARLLKRAAPRLRVLGHSEIPETHSIRIGSIIGAAA